MEKGGGGSQVHIPSSTKTDKCAEKFQIPVRVSEIFFGLDDAMNDPRKSISSDTIVRSKCFQ
jgi:hypothetical protein